MPRFDTVVADASPLISLEKLSAGFSLLEHTCARLLVPQVVLDEVSYGLATGVGYFERYPLSAGVDLQVIPDAQITPLPPAEAAALDPDERAALAVALEHRAPFLAEERKARRLAREKGLRVFGAAALIKIAWEEGGISRQDGRDLLDGLFRVKRINRKVLAQLLEALGR